jgi:hypothetical protein
VKEKRRFRKRLLQVLAGLAAAFVSAWWTGVFDGYFWGPEQVTLWLENVRRGESRPVEDRFRVVLCWLENDPDGKSTSNVAQAFASVEGVELVRSPSIVAASGAADDWREAMRQEARSVLEESDADLAIVGLVKEPGQALRTVTEITLPRAKHPKR